MATMFAKYLYRSSGLKGLNFLVLLDYAESSELFDAVSKAQMLTFRGHT